MAAPGGAEHRIQNLSGGLAGSMSLAELSTWCGERFASREVDSNPEPRPFDLPWVVLDSARAKKQWDWEPQTPVASILEEIAAHAEANPDWLEISKESA